ncbi:hypothetical protein ACFFK0_04220 [Paenibacillus chartarius]|uniref:ABC transporter permease n=1 Tax=Paenibacillus chartarius TaxID=747481 RepID=A0ABV6DG93_9BACL
MSLWSTSWQLARKELSGNVSGWVISVIFTLYTAFMLMVLARQINESIFNQEYVPFHNFGLNLFVLAMAPNCSFLFGGRYLNFHKNDSFTRHLRVMKALPISNKQLVVSRMMQLVVTAIIMNTLLFIMLFVWNEHDPLSLQLNAVNFIQLALSWCFCSITLGSAYVYWEMGYNGKVYLISGLWFCAVILLISAAAVFVLPQSFLKLLADSVQAYGWWIPLIGLAAAAVVILISARTTERRIAARDLF